MDVFTWFGAAEEKFMRFGSFALGDNDAFFLSSCVNSYIEDNATHH